MVIPTRTPQPLFARVSYCIIHSLYPPVNRDTKPAGFNAVHLFGLPADRYLLGVILTTNTFVAGDDPNLK